MDGKLKGHAALWVANIIWGLNAPIGKSVLWSERTRKESARSH